MTLVNLASGHPGSTQGSSAMAALPAQTAIGMRPVHARGPWRMMRRNPPWATGAGFISVLPAAGILASVGFALPMPVAVSLMSLSPVVVAFSARLRRRIDLTPEASIRAILGREN